jgi:hypothetical protein
VLTVGTGRAAKGKEGAAFHLASMPPVVLSANTKQRKIIKSLFFCRDDLTEMAAFLRLCLRDVFFDIGFIFLHLS